MPGIASTALPSKNHPPPEPQAVAEVSGTGGGFTFGCGMSGAKASGAPSGGLFRGSNRGFHHDDEEDLAAVPTTHPTHPPAVDTMAERRGLR